MHSHAGRATRPACACERTATASARPRSRSRTSSSGSVADPLAPDGVEHAVGGQLVERAAHRVCERRCSRLRPRPRAATPARADRRSARAGSRERCRRRRARRPPRPASCPPSSACERLAQRRRTRSSASSPYLAASEPVGRGLLLRGDRVVGRVASVSDGSTEAVAFDGTKSAGRVGDVGAGEATPRQVALSS